MNTVHARNPYQFVNINVKNDLMLDIPEPLVPPSPDRITERFIDRSEILLRWLEWNIAARREGAFDVFRFPATYAPEFEIDTTLICHGTPGCRADCTYRRKHANLTLRQDVGEYLVRRAKSMGFAAVLFSGGGENLEDAAYENFIKILTAAKKAGLRTNLATNGVNLNPTKIQELIYRLDSIRFSIPPIAGTYSHMGIIAPKILLARKLISSQFLSTKIYANLLMTPAMPIEELESSIRQLSQSGVDGIRLKSQHEWDSDQSRFVLRPDACANHVRAADLIKADTELKLPPVTISKLKRMMDEPAGPFPFHAYWYRDFNPLVVGCDAHTYACCEMKYQREFDVGEVQPLKDNPKVLTAPDRRPQPVLNNYCFKGCKGYLVNIDLQRLLNEFEARGKSMFDRPENVSTRERVLEGLVRSVLTN